MAAPISLGQPSGFHGAGSDEEHAPLVGQPPQQAAGGSVAAPPRWRAALPLRWLGTAFWNSGSACMLVSALSFTLASTIVKLVQRDIPIFEIVLARAVVSSGITSLTCRLHGLPTFGSAAPMRLKVARGMVGATAMVLSYESIVRLPLADSTVIFFLSPAFTAVLGWLLLGETFGWLTAAGCLASLGGVVMVAQPGSAAVDWSRQRLLGMAFGFCGSVLAAGAYICIRQIGKREHPLTVAMFFHSFSLLFSALPLSAGYPQPAVLPSPTQAALLLGLAACSFTANLLVNRAFQIELAARASAVNFSQVAFAWTIGAVFFGDRLTLLGVGGTALIAAGVVAVNLDKAARQAGEERDAAAGAVTDHSGRFKAKSSFKTELALLPEYTDGGGASGAGLIQSGAPGRQPGVAAQAAALPAPQYPPGERAAAPQ